jgi:DNA repair exonuclease SbcCD ATPase subunit
MTMPIGEPVVSNGQTPQPIVITNNPPAPPADQQYFTAAQLEAMRQQEKDKVYDRIQRAEEQANAFKTQLEELQAEKKARDDEAAKTKADADAAAQKAAEDKMTAAELIAQREKELLDRQEQFEKQIAAKQALLEKEQQFLALQSYTQRRVNEEVAQDNIAPEFLDYILGNTEAEIEASITKAKEKTASIAEAKAGGLPRSPGVSPTGFGPTGPIDALQGQQQFTPEQIANMNMDEYAAYRAATGIDKAGKDRGMFG